MVPLLLLSYAWVHCFRLCLIAQLYLLPLKKYALAGEALKGAHLVHIMLFVTSSSEWPTC